MDNQNPMCTNGGLRRLAMASPRKPVFDIDFTLRRTFRKPEFRPYQRKIIEAVLDRQDVFVQAATSFGKSLCFQLPAVIDHGITVVVSPLLALMNNQVAALRLLNIPVATVNSNTTHSEREDIFNDLQCADACALLGHPQTRLLYVTPELVQTQSFRKVLATIYDQEELSRVAIDEAHCISEWGHDFRKAYRHLSHFRSAYPSVPILCLTATATPAVQKDIMSSLGLNPAATVKFMTSTTRGNLFYEVRYTNDADDTRWKSLIKFLQPLYVRRRNETGGVQQVIGVDRYNPCSGIIYVTSRSCCDSLAQRLREADAGAVAYHAGLSAAIRTERQNKWIGNAPGHDIIVATTAFGMGIDKPDVRFVIHWNLPKSCEGYYQEAGRAGRDGNISWCCLWYSREDRDRASYRIAKDAANTLAHSKASAEAADVEVTKKRKREESFKALVKYCEQKDRCRHRVIGEFFAETDVEECEQMCDQLCDFCDEGPAEIRKRWHEGLADEEWLNTQRERDDFYVDEYD